MIAEVDEPIDRSTPSMVQHRIECEPVAVHVRYDREPHPKSSVGVPISVPFRYPRGHCSDRSDRASSAIMPFNAAGASHAWPIAPNLLEQDFTATRPNQKWVADIS